MKILMLTPYLPYPLLSGGQIRSFNLLKNLAKKHQITLIALIKSESEKRYIKNIEAYCHKVIVARRPEKPWTTENIIKTVFGQYPFLVVRNFSSDAREAVIRELKDEKFDLIHAETFYVMPHIPETTIPVLLVEQTIEYLVYQHYVDTLTFAPLRWLFGVDVKKIRYWEEYYWKKAKRVVAMSEPDKKVMQSHLTHLRVSIVPNGVDTSEFIFKKKSLTFSPVVLFVGNFKWLQNREAVLVLVKDIWPIIAGKLPSAKLWIVGRYPPKEILALKESKIEISDSIENISDAYTSSHVLLAPIYGPGGTRYKILEAMACGVPVVTTPTGIAGLEITNGKEALVETDPQKLAQATIKVLTSSQLYNHLAVEADAFVRSKYNWETIATALDKVYETVARYEKN